MKRNLLLAILAVAGLSGACVLAQTPMTRGAAVPPAPMGDMKGMMDNKMTPDMAAMMEKMSPEMKMRCQMLMNTTVVPTDAAAMLALKSQLKLSDTQAARLEAINKDAQDKALAVLAEEQKKLLDTLPKTPQTLMDMHEQMMKQMNTLMGGTMGGQLMNCPMMKMVAETTPPAHDAHDTHDTHDMHDLHDLPVMPLAPKP